MAKKFTRRNFIKASVATGIVAGAVAAPAVVSPFRRSVLATGGSAAAPLPQAITSLSSTFNLNGTAHTVEHEVRSATHPMYLRPLVNRNPAQTNRTYATGHDQWLWAMDPDQFDGR